VVPDSLMPGDGQDVLARYRRALEKRDPELMMEIYADDPTYRPDSFSNDLVGANAVRAHWNALAASQAHVDFDTERSWVSGRTVLSSWHGVFTVRTTAERIRMRGFSTMELDTDGRIVRQRDWPSSKSIGIDSRHRPEPASEGEDDG
jgi:hypothetical protein